MLYNYYPKPNLESEFYIGTGLGCRGLFQHAFQHKISGSFMVGPEFVLGRQFKTKTGDTRFLQMRVSWPTFSPSSHHHKTILFPFTLFSYGIGF